MKRKPRSSIELFDENLRSILDRLNIKSPNYVLPPIPKRMAYAGTYFEALENILSEQLILTGDDDDENFV